MSKSIIGYGRQNISDADIAAVVDVLRSDYLTQGPVIERFEAALAEKVNARHAIAVSNGTAALHIACLAGGLEVGTRAAVPTLTFVATANAPHYCGASVDLLDVDAKTLGMTGRVYDESLAHNQKASVVLPVYFGGLAAGAADLRNSVGSSLIIADASHALGGLHEDGTPIGGCRHYDMATFSFHPVKPITTGEGGAVTTNDDELARKLRLFRNHGIVRDTSQFVEPVGDPPESWRYEQQYLGFNYRMTDFQAALGLSQLSKLDSMLVRRREIAAHYDENFSDLAHVAIPQSAPEERARSGLHLYHIAIDFTAIGKNRVEIMSALRASGIGSQVHYIPVHRQPFHNPNDRLKIEDFPNAELHYQRTLSLPLFSSMKDEDVELVTKEILRLLS